jgi:hypothetical protein
MKQRKGGGYQGSISASRILLITIADFFPVELPKHSFQKLVLQQAVMGTGPVQYSLPSQQGAQKEDANLV